MNLESILAGQPGTSQAKLLPKKELGKEAFMKLLVAQMQNQDPMEPTDNGAFVAQLAQFSSLEQLQAMNEGITNMMLLQQGNAMVDQISQAAALIGKQIAWDGPYGSGAGVVEAIQVQEGLVVAMVAGQAVPLIDVVGLKDAPAPNAGAEGEANDD